jgi:hypothetical protein
MKNSNSQKIRRKYWNKVKKVWLSGNSKLVAEAISAIVRKDVSAAKKFYETVS